MRELEESRMRTEERSKQGRWDAERDKMQTYRATTDKQMKWWDEMRWEQNLIFLIDACGKKGTGESRMTEKWEQKIESIMRDLEESRMRTERRSKQGRWAERWRWDAEWDKMQTYRDDRQTDTERQQTDRCKPPTDRQMTLNLLFFCSHSALILLPFCSHSAQSQHAAYRQMKRESHEMRDRQTLDKHRVRWDEMRGYEERGMRVEFDLRNRTAVHRRLNGTSKERAGSQGVRNSHENGRIWAKHENRISFLVGKRGDGEQKRNESRMRRDEMRADRANGEQNESKGRVEMSVDWEAKWDAKWEQNAQSEQKESRIRQRTSLEDHRRLMIFKLVLQIPQNRRNGLHMERMRGIQSAYFQSIWSKQWKVRAILVVKTSLSRQQSRIESSRCAQTTRTLLTLRAPYLSHFNGNAIVLHHVVSHRRLLNNIPEKQQKSVPKVLQEWHAVLLCDGRHCTGLIEESERNGMNVLSKHLEQAMES